MIMPSSDEQTPSDRSNQANTATNHTDEWRLSELINLIAAEIDCAQDTLVLKSHNRSLSMMLNQFSLDLQVNVRHDSEGKFMFRTVNPGETGITVIKLGFTPVSDTQLYDFRKHQYVKHTYGELLDTLPGIESLDIEKLKTVGIYSTKDFELYSNPPARLTDVSQKTGIDEERIRSWANISTNNRITQPKSTN